MFLLDAAGALVSALFLGIVLKRYEPWFGMPADVLEALTIAAVAFAFCSWFGYMAFGPKWKPWLRTIATANILYGGVTAILIVVHLSRLTPWGMTYFIAELVVLAVFVRWEFLVAAKGVA